MTLYEKRTGARDNINKQQLLVLLSLMRHPEEPGRTMIEVSSRTFRHDNARTHARAHTHTHTHAHTHTHTQARTDAELSWFVWREERLSSPLQALWITLVYSKTQKDTDKALTNIS